MTEAFMAETENPEAPVVTPRAARFGEGPEGRVARRERKESGAPSRFSGLGQFLHDVRAEMRRVSWPSFNHVRNTTLITIVAVIFFAIYLFAVDLALSRFILGLDWLIEKLARVLGLA
jgi:preprotein translocase subunit SecE